MNLMIDNKYEDDESGKYHIHPNLFMYVHRNVVFKQQWWLEMLEIPKFESSSS